MVEFVIPEPFPKMLYDLIPDQREKVESFFQSGKLITYTLSMDRSKLWALFIADNESELIHYIEALPLTPYFDYDYKEIMFHDTIQFLPSMSLN